MLIIFLHFYSFVTKRLLWPLCGAARAMRVGVVCTMLSATFGGLVTCVQVFCCAYCRLLAILLVGLNLGVYGILVYHQSLYMLSYTLTVTGVAVLTLVVWILSVIWPQSSSLIWFRYQQVISSALPYIYIFTFFLFFVIIIVDNAPLSAGSVGSKPVKDLVVVSCEPAVQDSPPAFFCVVGVPLVVKEVTNPVGSAVCAVDYDIVTSWSTWLWSWFGYSGSKPTPMTGGVATAGGFTPGADQGVLTSVTNQEVQAKQDHGADQEVIQTALLPLERAFAIQKAKMAWDLLSLQHLAENLQYAPAMGDVPLLPLTENPHGFEPALVAMPGDLTPPVQEMPIGVAALIDHLRLLCPETAFFHYFTLGEGEGAVRDAIFFGLDAATPEAYCILPLFPGLAFGEIFFLRLADDGYYLDNAAYVAALERIVHVPHILNDCEHLTDLQCSTVQLVYNYFWDVSQNDPELFAQVWQLVSSYSSDPKIDLEILKLFQEIDVNIGLVETGEPHEIDCDELVRVFTGDGSDDDPSALERKIK